LSATLGLSDGFHQRLPAAAKHRIKVLKTFFDEAVSGQAGLNLEKEFGELLKVIQPGQVILADSQDRLGRQDPFVLMNLVTETVNKDVEFMFEDGTILNATTINQLVVQVPAFLKAALARREIQERGRKIHQAWVGKNEPWVQATPRSALSQFLAARAGAPEPGGR
jgi:DNA invertase Pin-like site-specific DNA recombinase